MISGWDWDILTVLTVLTWHFHILPPASGHEGCYVRRASSTGAKVQPRPGDSLKVVQWETPIVGESSSQNAYDVDRGLSFVIGKKYLENLKRICCSQNHSRIFSSLKVSSSFFLSLYAVEHRISWRNNVHLLWNRLWGQKSTHTHCATFKSFNSTNQAESAKNKYGCGEEWWIRKIQILVRTVMFYIMELWSTLFRSFSESHMPYGSIWPKQIAISRLPSPSLHIWKKSRCLKGNWPIEIHWSYACPLSLFKNFKDILL